MSTRPLSTDALLHLGWDRIGGAIARWFDEPDPDLLVEGLQVPRGLRAWRDRNPGRPPPVDRVIVLTRPLEVQLPRHVSLGKGHDTVLREIYSWLAGRIEVRG